MADDTIDNYLRIINNNYESFKDLSNILCFDICNEELNETIVNILDTII